MNTVILEILEIQNKIFGLMHAKNGVTVHFIPSKSDLSLVTYNSANREFFLVKTIAHSYPKEVEKSMGLKLELELHQAMLEYVEELIDCIDKNKSTDTVGDSYTVVWQKDKEKTNKSYFYGSDIEDVIKKFFYGKEALKHMFKILEIKLNPIS